MCALVLRGALACLVAISAVGCSSVRTVWLPEGDDDPPGWLADALESPPPGTLLGVGESLRSEQDARDAAMADIDRQILGMLPDQEVAAEELRVRRDDVLEVWRRMQRTSSAAFGSRWGSVLHQACRRDEATDGHTPPRWTYYILVRFDRNALDEIVRRAEARAADRRRRRQEAVRRYRELVERLSASAQSALAGGRYRAALVALAELSGMAVPNDLEHEPSPGVIAQTILSDFLDTLDVTVERRWRTSSCAFELVGSVRDRTGSPVTGLPLVVVTADGRARVEGETRATGAGGHFRAMVFPDSDRSLELAIGVRIPSRVRGRDSRRLDRGDEAAFGEAAELVRVRLQPPPDRPPVVELRVAQDWKWRGMLVWKRPWLRTAVAVMEVRNTGGVPLHVRAVVRSLRDAGGYPVACDGRGTLLLAESVRPGARVRRRVPMPWLAGCVNRYLEDRSSSREVAFELLVRVQAEGSCPWMVHRDEVAAVLVPPPRK